MPIELVVVTPQGEAFRGPVDSVVLPGSEGEFGVLPNHERFLTPLRVGVVEISTAEETIHAAVAEGFADVGGEQVTVLVESCELAADIDIARAELAREQAEQGLASLQAEDDAERLAATEASLSRARNRLTVGGNS